MQLIENECSASYVLSADDINHVVSVRCTPWRPGATKAASPGKAAGGFGKPVVAEADHGRSIQLDDELNQLLSALSKGAQAKFEVAEPASALPKAPRTLQLSISHLTLSRGDQGSLKARYSHEWLVSAPTRKNSGPLFLLQLGPSKNLELEFKDQRQRDLAVIRLRQLIAEAAERSEDEEDSD